MSLIVTDTVGIGSLIVSVLLMIIAVPACFVAWGTLTAKRTALEADKRARAAVAESEHIAGIVHSQIERVLHQVTPSNGHTTAHTVEAIEKKLDANKAEYTSAIRGAMDAITSMQAALLDHLREHP